MIAGQARERLDKVPPHAELLGHPIGGSGIECLGEAGDERRIAGDPALLLGVTSFTDHVGGDAVEVGERVANELGPILLLEKPFKDLLCQVGSILGPPQSPHEVTMQCLPVLLKGLRCRSGWDRRDFGAGVGHRWSTIRADPT